MAKAAIGIIPEYIDGQDWDNFQERLTSYFVANGVEAENQKHILLTVMDESTYRLLKDLCLPSKPADKTYAQLVELMKKHKNPTPNKMVERYNFHGASRLRHLAEHCVFGEQLDEQLRDRFITGINDERMLRRLLRESDLTLQDALEKCTAIEQAEKHTALLTTDPSTSVIANELTARKPASQFNKVKLVTRKCFRCGKDNHGPEECRYKDVICRFCKNILNSLYYKGEEIGIYSNTQSRT